MRPVLECRHILRNGHKCHGTALSDQHFCRHHAPQSHPAGPPPATRRERYSRLARWRSLGANASWLNPVEVPGEILSIPHSLLSEDQADSISDVCAGRYLRTLLRRLGHLPFTLPDAEPYPVPAPAAVSPGPASRPAPAAALPSLPRVDDAFDETFAGARLQPGKPMDRATAARLICAFEKRGLLPPELARPFHQVPRP